MTAGATCWSNLMTLREGAGARANLARAAGTPIMIGDIARRRSRTLVFHLTRSSLLFAVFVVDSTITVDEFVWLLRCIYLILLVYFHG
jgi:hypothetical protein